jgi:transcriptional regulator with XRE-family HTH domain
MKSATVREDLDPNDLELGPLVRYYRKQRSMTQQEVADRAGISTAYIGLIEQGQRGQRPARDMVRSLAQALDLTLDETEILFRAGGHLEDGETLFSGDAGVIEAIESDPTLPDASKRLMINLYGTLARSRSRR